MAAAHLRRKAYRSLAMDKAQARSLAELVKTIERSNAFALNQEIKSLSAEIVFVRNRRQYGYQALTNEQTRWR
jgi:hypothetical protein